MLILLAHESARRAAHDLWDLWSVDPFVPVALAAAGWAYHRGSRRRAPAHSRMRARCFFGGLLVLAVALASPLDVMAGELASAHMVQHVLILVVAAPLLALGEPLATTVAGAPRALGRAVGAVRRQVPAVRAAVRALRDPVVVWLLHTGTLWFWHASGPYDAALRSDALHAAEHVSFVVTGVLFWSAVVHVRRVPRTSYGHAALLVFTIALQSVFLAALLTFATTPWYDAYRATTAAWGIDRLTDQQLAGAIMWVPAGLIYAAVGIGLALAWVRSSTSDGFEDDWGSSPRDLVTRPLRSRR